MKINKDQTNFSVEYSSKYSLLSLFLLLIIIIYSFFKNSSNWLSYIKSIIVMYLFSFLYDLFYEKFSLNIQNDNLNLVKINGFLKRKVTNFNFKITQIESIQIETIRSSSKRLVLKLNNEKIPLTQSYSSSSSTEILAYEMFDWLKTKSIHIQIEKI